MNIEKSNDSNQFKNLMLRPNYAWPTLSLLAIAVLLFVFVISAYSHSQIGLVLAVALNTVASYLAFTVMHDASHNSVSQNKNVNEWCGRIASWMLLPAPLFRMFRYVHMQHHRFVNEPSKDPDHYASRGPKWLLPLRWATQDIYYFVCFLNPKVFSKRPVSERREFILASSVGVILLLAVIYFGWLNYYLLLFILPARIATLVLVLAFDYLPHHPHSEKGVTAPYQATQNRLGLEWLMTPLFLGQNYHLVHHLYPKVPFYRYNSIWQSNISYHQQQNPAETSLFKLSSLK